jgi:CRISPR system Cascade subunit CasE
MAFPFDPKSDPYFLKPFNPQNFDGNRVHDVERGSQSGFLFRIDPQPGGRVVILVQSAAKPDWSYAFQNADFLLRDFLAAPPHMVEYDPTYQSGDRLRFRIRIALSAKKKVSTAGLDLRKCKETKDKYGRQKSQSKRVALTWEKNQNPEDVIRVWFANKGHDGGFAIDTQAFRAVQIGWGNGIKPDGPSRGGNGNSNRHHLRFRSALLDGTLTVTDADRFRSTLVQGVGSGKAFGFGLLSVAPCALLPPAAS